MTNKDTILCHIKRRDATKSLNCHISQITYRTPICETSYDDHNVFNKTFPIRFHWSLTKIRNSYIPKCKYNASLNI